MSEPLTLPVAVRRSYAGPACPRCGHPLAAAEMAAGPQSCSRCGRAFEATPFQPPPRTRPAPVRSVAEAGPEGAVPCGFHAGNAAESSCSRCGVLMCSLCRIDADGQAFCPGCFERLRLAGELPSFNNRFPNYGGRALLLGIFGCLVYFLGIVTGPVVLYFAGKGVAFRRKTGEGEGWGTLALAFLLGLVQIGIFAVLVVAIVAAFLEGTKSP